jgi:hypothetical protein
MNKISILFIVLLLFLLDWAALHDILKGEPEPYEEIAMLLVSIFIFLIIFFKQKGGVKTPPF